ncbi:MAG: S1 family peptidase [Actinomycetota bacterium]|nr:S1 family peptidase [Actinomycetota bacterium]
MSRPAVIRAMGAAVLAAVLGAVTALPAVAAPAAPATSGPPAALLSALQRDLGLSAEDAVARLYREADGAAVERDMQQTLGATFAGAWFDATSGSMVVAITDPALADAVRAAGAQPRAVQRDARTLDATMAELDDRASSVPDAVTGWFVDAPSNSVVVTATDPAAGEAFAAGTDGVRVRRVAEEPRPLADLVGGEVIYAPDGGRCSIGFVATRGGTPYVITAGHCTRLGGTWAGIDGSAIGPVAGTSYPGNDFGIIEVTSGSWTPTGTVSDYAGGRVRVTGSAEAVVGASTCRSGSSTGYRCGAILAKNQTVNYGNGEIIDGLTRTNACAETGDSGGSFITGTQAQGVTSGGIGDCRSAGETFFQPVNEVLSTYGLSLVRG